MRLFQDIRQVLEIAQQNAHACKSTSENHTIKPLFHMVSHGNTCAYNSVNGYDQPTRNVA